MNDPGGMIGRALWALIAALAVVAVAVVARALIQYADRIPDLSGQALPT